MDKCFDRFVQVAGVLNKEEIDLLIANDVKYIGFPLRLDYHKPDMSEDQAALLISEFPEDVKGILITYENNVSELVNLCKKLNISFVQIHGDMDVKLVKEFRNRCSEIKIIKSLIVGKFTKEDLFKQVDLYYDFVDAFITDTFDGETKACGATGKTHDWKITSDIVKYTSKPVILAGGLNPENVFDGICSTRPCGVDVHTGVEDSLGNKNPELVTLFMQEAKRGLQYIS